MYSQNIETFCMIISVFQYNIYTKRTEEKYSYTSFQMTHFNVFLFFSFCVLCLLLTYNYTCVCVDFIILFITFISITLYSRFPNGTNETSIHQLL